ncbi:uncharacterized protein TOT_010000375 [Theileria orientalis strain Shintoku]|uniref:RRM domain-containing protein n=1 Tax=Theileria orientalis strain Shintoku TaxID=869250 RepID=J4C7E7_THEOR|nr:uncharacterized protein TOT_010000375 [Theileria orientalis strain Shintoku]PVC52703.1 hypothetical protein MACL_00000578 [Theileria orientalis]BAM38908.1 uncharacterized protein TOT_010000375 [Theileria orientalis strain Shintoku]|eukprot:XP_009689209.1 uncharacterized protein TOT_010000375 [Theileria orientalis strain Shintoku]
MAISICSDGNLKSRLDLIDPLSRIFICNIPTKFSKAKLKKSCDKYGGIEVYVFQDADFDMGWALVGFSSRRSVKRLIRQINRSRIVSE